MNTDFDKMLQELIYGYRTKCAKDAKLLDDSVEAGEAVSMYSILIKNANQPSLTTNEKLLHSTRLFYFMGYCMKYNNGIPILEVLSDWIDNDEKRKVINAVKSQSNLFDILIEQGVDINILADYIDEREIIEYAISEEKKSTGVLKRIIEHKKSSIKKEPKITPNTIEQTIKESDKYEEKIRITKVATADDLERLKNMGAKDIEIGQEISYLPEPKNKEELFERFEKLHAQRYFETLKDIFREKYGVGNKRIIEDELAALNSFIEKANQLTTKETFQNKWVEPKETDLHEYSRLANGYYKNPNKKFYSFGYFNNNAVQVHAQYFLYKEWLEKELKKYQPIEHGNTDNNEKEIEVWESEYKLRQFIDTATRWGIEAVYSARTEQNPYSIFDYEVEHSRDNFEKFRTQLNRKLCSLHPDLWKAVEIDLNDKFLVGLNKYIEWYKQHENELEKFQPYCPYSIMLSVIESTKKEILKYFPELNKKLLPEKKPTPNQKLKNGYSSKEWCTILFFTDYIEKNEANYVTDIVKAFHEKHKLPFAETSFLQNFKDVKRHIEKSEKQAVRLIEKIIPYFSQDKEAKDYAENQLSIVLDDLDRK